MGLSCNFLISASRTRQLVLQFVVVEEVVVLVVKGVVVKEVVEVVV